MVNINDTISDKNLLQEAFLDYIVHDTNLIKNKVHSCLFKLLYDPQNQDKKRDEIVEIMKEQYKLHYIEGTINVYAKKIRKTIVNEFKQEMLADGLESTIDSVLTESEVVGRRNNGIYPHQVTYKWLWEKKFPRMGWELAKKIAIPAFKGLNMVNLKKSKMIALENSQRDREGLIRGGLTLGPENFINDNNCIKLNTAYRLLIDLPIRDKYLLLINNSVGGDIYLLSPSKGFSDVPHTKLLGELYLLPPDDQREGRAQSLKYEIEGDQYYWAIVTEQPIELSWVHWESNPEDIILNQERLEEIFVKLGQQSDSQVFYKWFKVVT